MGIMNILDSGHISFPFYASYLPLIQPVANFVADGD